MALIETLGLPRHHWRTLRIANTGLTRVEFTESGAALGCFNLTGHLVDVQDAEEIEQVKADEQ